MRNNCLLWAVLATFAISLAWANMAKVRWCRAKVRTCSRKSFGAFIEQKLTGGNGTNETGGAAPPAVPEAPPDGRKRRDLETELDPYELGADDLLDRFRREDPPPPDPPAAGGDAGGNSTAGNATEAGPPPVVIPPSIPALPPPIYRNDDLEETFYKCLDELGVGKCMWYMFERCNWHDGTSAVIKKYCAKWGIPCEPCMHLAG